MGFLARDLLKIKEKHNLPFVYNGGKDEVIICGKKPDFVDFEGKRIIEVFSAWHKKDFFLTRTNSPDYFSPLLRKKLFAKEGYKTLVIWENELKSNPIQTENKIIKFFSQ